MIRISHYNASFTETEATKVTVELRVEGNEDRHGDTEVNVSIESISSDGPWLDGKEEAFQFANDPILQLSIDSNSSCEGKEESCLNVSITGIIQMNSNQSNALLDQMHLYCCLLPSFSSEDGFSFFFWGVYCH